MGVFEDFVDRAKDVADVASKKTGEVVEKSRLKMKIMRVKAQIKDAYERLGSTVYKIHSNDYENSALVSSIIEEIDDAFTLLKELNNQYAEVSNVIVCNTCSAKNPEDAMYCSRCGSKLSNEFTGYEEVIRNTEEAMQEEEDLLRNSRETLHAEVKGQESSYIQEDEKKAGDSEDGNEISKQ